MTGEVWIAILATACVLLIAGWAVFSGLIHRLNGVIEDLREERSGERLIVSRFADPRQAEQAGWVVAWQRVVALRSDSLELNLAQRCMGAIDGALTSLGIPHSMEIYNVGDAAVEAGRRLLSDGYADTLRTEIGGLAPDSSVVALGAKTLDNHGFMALRVRTPQAFAKQADEQIEVCVRRERDRMARPEIG